MQIFGLQPEERVVDLTQWHERWLALIHTEDRPRIAEAAAAALRGGPPYDVEYRVVRPGGEVRIIYSRGEVTWDESGRPRRMFGMMQDITELRRAEDELRASEARFRTFVDHATDAFFLHDDQLTVLDVNRQACESLGYSREELIGMHPRDFDVAWTRRPSSGWRSGSAPGNGHLRDPPPAQGWHRLRGRDPSHQFQQGTQSLRYALVRDITERKRAEQRLVAQHSVTRILAEVTTVEEATPRSCRPCASAWDGTWARCGASTRGEASYVARRCGASRRSRPRNSRPPPGRARSGLGVGCQARSGRAVRPRAFRMSCMTRLPARASPRVKAARGLRRSCSAGEVLGVIDVVSREIASPTRTCST